MEKLSVFKQDPVIKALTKGIDKAANWLSHLL